MAILSFTLSEEGVTAFRDALICLQKFSDDVSLEAKKESVRKPLTKASILPLLRYSLSAQFVLTTLNNSKSAYASFKFATNRFFSKYHFQPTGQFRERFYCTLYVRSLISLFRSRSSSDTQNHAEKQTFVDRCDVMVEDGEGMRSRFVARMIFRNGLTSSHRLPFEVAVPVHAKFTKQSAPHHWAISSRTLRQLMDHLGPGIEYIDINTDGDHVNFTCFSEKTVSDDAVLKKPLQTSISVEVDEFDDIDVEDKLHIIISVKDFRAIVQHAGIAGNTIAARYSLPARPIQLSYTGDALTCEFLVMTLGERGSNPSQTIKKGRRAVAQREGPVLVATSRRTSVAPFETSDLRSSQASNLPTKLLQPNPTSHTIAARASASRIGAFDLRPSQKPPPPTVRSESLFVDDDGWEPVRDEDEDLEEDARLEWDYSANSQTKQAEEHAAVQYPTSRSQTQDPDAQPTYLEPTQNLADVRDLALFPD